MAKWSELVKQVEAIGFVDDPEVVAIVYNSVDGGMTTVAEKVDTDGEVYRDEYDNLEFLFVEDRTYPPGSAVQLQLVFQLKEPTNG